MRLSVLIAIVLAAAALTAPLYAIDQSDESQATREIERMGAIVLRDDSQRGGQ